jgi:hypothetical protein
MWRSSATGQEVRSNDLVDRSDLASIVMMATGIVCKPSAGEG